LSQDVVGHGKQEDDGAVSQPGKSNRKDGGRGIIRVDGAELTHATSVGHRALIASARTWERYTYLQQKPITSVLYILDTACSAVRHGSGAKIPLSVMFYVCLRLMLSLLFERDFGSKKSVYSNKRDESG
jgi:hypothetical protein